MYKNCGFPKYFDTITLSYDNIKPYFDLTKQQINGKKYQIQTKLVLKNLIHYGKLG